MVNSRKDRKLSEEHKKKISDTMKGRPMSKDVYIKGVTIVKTLLAKPVIQLSLSGEFIREFPSIKEAARSLNIKSDRDIIRCCKEKENQELVINGNIKMNKYGTKERTTLF